MNRLPYPLAFLLAVVALTVGAVLAFQRISEASLGRPSIASEVDPAERDPGPGFAPAAPAEYAAFAAEDSMWRARHARPFTLAELRARGDGRRTPRQAMQDRVYRHTQRGDRNGAIGELQRWLSSNPGDRAALLSLARLLNETGRTDDAVRRYRQLLALQERGRQ